MHLMPLSFSNLDSVAPENSHSPLSIPNQNIHVTHVKGSRLSSPFPHLSNKAQEEKQVSKCLENEQLLNLT